MSELNEVAPETGPGWFGAPVRKIAMQFVAGLAGLLVAGFADVIGVDLPPGFGEQVAAASAAWIVTVGVGYATRATKRGT